MFYVHNNQLPHVKTAQVESVYGLIKAEGRVDLLWWCFGSFYYTLTNPYRYIWHPAVKKLTRKWAATDRNRSAPWPTTCYSCTVLALRGCQASGKTSPSGPQDMGEEGWWKISRLRLSSESLGTGKMSFFLADIYFYGKKKMFLCCCCCCHCQGSTKGAGDFFFLIKVPS